MALESIDDIVSKFRKEVGLNLDEFRTFKQPDSYIIIFSSVKKHEKKEYGILVASFDEELTLDSVSYSGRHPKAKGIIELGINKIEKKSSYGRHDKSPFPFLGISPDKQAKPGKAYDILKTNYLDG
jgi:hypothetical protein